MAWYDTKQAAVDPDNPAANEQIPFSEWNAMVTYLKDKIVDKTVNTAAIGNDKVLVYKTATSTFVFEAQSAVGAIDDLTDVTISGVPADKEVLAYNIGTSKWINQTAAEAGLATVAGLAAYYPLSGATLTGNLNMGDYLIDDVDDLQAYDVAGILFRNNVAAARITLATTSNSFVAAAEASMGGYAITNVLDPTSAQHASTKNYDDTHLFTKEAVTTFTDGYIPIYRTASGKFEMEAQSGGGFANPMTVDLSMGTHKITAVVDPTTAQEVSTKNYADLHLIGRGIVGTPLSDGYGLIYRTTSGKFEMENLSAPIFEEHTNVIREKAGYDNDFLIGSPSLGDDGNTAHDYRMWFDKSKGAFRTGRTTSTQWDLVNVGLYSFAAGYNTTASGQGATAIGGTTKASASSSFAMGGTSYANLVGQLAHANGSFSVTGDAQHTRVIAMGTTTDATANVDLYLDEYGTEPAILIASRTWAFNIMVSAREPATGDSGIYEIKGGIKRDAANNTALVGAITKTTIAEDQAAWDVTAVADNVNNALSVQVTGQAAKTIHWVATINLTEVG